MLTFLVLSLNPEASQYFKATEPPPLSHLSLDSLLVLELDPNFHISWSLLFLLSNIFSQSSSYHTQCLLQLKACLSQDSLVSYVGWVHPGSLALLNRQGNM